MKVTLKILRFNPETDQKPWWGEYEVDMDPDDRVLDAIHKVKWYQDGTLTVRRSCAHGICGSDAMVINGRNGLACRTIIKDIGSRITLEPLRGFRVIKDLVVDMEPFMEKYRSVMPYLINDEDPGPRERLQSPAERAIFDESTKCILCGCCTASCPSFWANPDYLGPAAAVQAHRFIFDSRDRATEERLAAVGGKDGVWRCRTIFNCVEACPREINITKAIGEIKKALLYNDG